MFMKTNHAGIKIAVVCLAKRGELCMCVEFFRVDEYSIHVEDNRLCFIHLLNLATARERYMLGLRSDCRFGIRIDLPTNDDNFEILSL
jgi:hypothetical protein